MRDAPFAADASAFIPAPLPATRRHAQPSPQFDVLLNETQALLQEAATRYQPIIQASSLGAEDVVITHLIQTLELDIPVFVLDTGALHAETQDLLARTRRALGPRLRIYTPDARTVDRFVQQEGSDAMYRSIELRKACCGIRKLEPLARALDGHRAWITGLRREQSTHRADVPPIDDREAGRSKINPLADWRWGDVWHYIALHQVDYNPLHDRFFPSIGCAPCTRAISLGEDFRAGRWWWEHESAKECGLHAATQDSP